MAAISLNREKHMGAATPMYAFSTHFDYTGFTFYSLSRPGTKPAYVKRRIANIQGGGSRKPAVQ